MQTLFGGGEEKSNGFAASLAAPPFRDNGGGDALQNAAVMVHTATNGDGISKRDLMVAPSKIVDEDDGLMSSGCLPPLITPISDGLSPLGRRESTENGDFAVKSDSFHSETPEIYSEPLPSAKENFTATVSDGLPVICSDLPPNNGEATVTTKKNGGSGRDKSEETTNTGRSC